MQLITAFRNGKIYASIQEPAVSHLFNQKKKISTMPDREEVKPENSSSSSIHDFYSWSCPACLPICNLKAIKYKAKIKLTQKVS